jgi:hypothetical protein
MSQPKFIGDQPVAVHYHKFDSTKLLITPAQAGVAIGYAQQTTHNLLSTGKFPIPIVKLGNRKMVRVSDLIKFVDELYPASASTQPPRRPGRPTKEETIRREAEKKGGAA